MSREMLTRLGRAGRTRVGRWLIPLGGCVLLAVLFFELGPTSIVSLFETIGWNIVIVVALFGAHEAVLAMTIGQCLPAGHHVSFRQLLLVRFSGEVARTMAHGVPFLAEPTRAWVLSRQGVDAAHAYGAAVAEFTANSTTSALVIASVLGVTLTTMNLGSHVSALATILAWSAIVYVTAVTVAIGTRTYLIGAIVRRIGGLPVIGRRLRVDPAAVRRMEDAIFLVLRDRPSALARVLLCELAAQVLLVLELYWAMRSMGLEVSVGRALVVDALTKTAGSVQFMGASEGGFALVFSWLGLTAAAGFTLSLVKRVRSVTVAAVGLGLLKVLEPSDLSKTLRGRHPKVI